MANPKSSLELTDPLDAAQESSSKRFSWDDIWYYLNVLLRFRWVLIAPFCLAMLTGIYLAVALPRMYQSDATILIEPQKVPDRYVQATVPLDMDARIASLAEQILSRSNLIDLIERFRVYSDSDSQSQRIDDKLAMMRKNIKVERAGSRASAFRISFLDSDPEKGIAVVRNMTNFVVDENLKMRESRAIGISDFLNDELTKMRARLEEVEKAIEEYRRMHMGELPEQLQGNLTILERLQRQLSESHQRLREEKNRVLIVEKQAKLAQQMSSMLQNIPLSPQAPPGEPKNLEDLRKRLAELETKYTENHPDVIVLKKRIKQLEEEPFRSDQRPVPQTLETAPGPNTELLVPEWVTERQGIIGNIKNIEAEIESLKAQIKLYQRRVEDTPKREQELISLKRDYENIKATYNSVLARKLEAEIALNMELKEKGEQFRILDPPRASTKPVSPNLNLIFLACIFAGLGIGGGIIFLLEFFDNSVRKPEALQAKLALPVLMVMPAMDFMQSQRSRKMGWLNNGLSVAGGLASLGLFVCFAAVTVLNLPWANEILKGLLR